jgi:hypothetical protein
METVWSLLGTAGPMLFVVIVGAQIVRLILKRVRSENQEWDPDGFEGWREEDELPLP